MGHLQFFDNGDQATFVVSFRITPLPAEGYRADALKPEPIERQVSGAALFPLSESPALAGGEFGKRAQRAVDALGEGLGLPFLLLRFLWASKENEG